MAEEAARQKEEREREKKRKVEQEILIHFFREGT